MNKNDTIQKMIEDEFRKKTHRNLMDLCNYVLLKLVEKYPGINFPQVFNKGVTYSNKLEKKDIDKFIENEFKKNPRDFKEKPDVADSVFFKLRKKDQYITYRKVINRVNKYWRENEIDEFNKRVYKYWIDYAKKLNHP